MVRVHLSVWAGWGECGGESLCVRVCVCMCVCERERENSNLNLKTLFYKDYRLRERERELRISPSRISGGLDRALLYRPLSLKSLCMHNGLAYTICWGQGGKRQLGCWLSA